MRLLFPLALALGASGCATTLSTLQTAEPTRVGQVQLTGGMGFYANVGPGITLVDQGIKQAAAIREAERSGEPYTLSEEAQQELITAGIALAVAPPSQGWEIGARTGIFENADVGLRYSVNAVRLDAKYRFLHRESGPEGRPIRGRKFDMAVGFGVSRYLFDNPVMDALSYVELADFSRWDFEVPVIASFELGEFFRVYGGPKYLYSRTSLDANLVELSDRVTVATSEQLRLPSLVHSHFYGATVGVGAGYRWVHLMVELTGGYTHSRPMIFGQRRSLGGPTFYPAIGFNVKWP